MMLQHARVLAQKYAVDSLQEKMKATEPEIDKYLAIIRKLTPTRRTAPRRKKC
jgi:hypothetical protein